MTDQWTASAHAAIAEIPPPIWDACANPENPAGAPRAAGDKESYNPFVAHAFLAALEESGCVAARTGWAPQHLALRAPGGESAANAADIVAVAPCYLKSHSMGEYVFDHAWADAYERAGGRYYPKLQICVPFTPVPGPRLLVRADAPQGARERLIGAIASATRQLRASSAHVTFALEDEWSAMGAEGFLQRTGQQFHFANSGYRDFDDFLDQLASRKRKAIRKERAAALESGVSIELVTSDDLTEAHWDAFFAFYMDTGARKWGRPYLNRQFFSLLSEKMKSRILLVMARRGGRYVAGALNMIGDNALYGRNWGAIEDIPFLHFELCYYQAIEFAIARGLKRVEAGAQGEHKIARGYLPVKTYSAHDLVDPRLRHAIDDYLQRERDHIDEAIEAYSEEAPFRKPA